MRHASIIAAALWLIPASALSEGLHDAVRDGNRAGIDHLMAQKGIDINTSDAQGATALHWAAFYGDSTLVKRLLARGARLDLQVTNGNTPLHQAAYAGHDEIVALLLEGGASVDARNERGYTPLHWAARNGHSRTALVLIDAGASQDAPAEDGTTPRTLAKTEGHPEVATAMALVPRRRPTPAPARVSSVKPRAGSVVQPAQKPTHPVDTTARYRVQMAAGRSDAAARQEWMRLKRKHPELLGNLELFIDRVPRAGGSAWYRVRTEAMNETRAFQLCDALKQRRIDCLVSRRH